jgi:hypothetical protein
MITLDLRSTGALTQADEDYLAQLIARVCGKDKKKWQLSITAALDFGWDSGKLINFCLADLVCYNSARSPGFISSGEWLCALLASGPSLGRDHLLIAMAFVNAKLSMRRASKGKYRSACETWADSPINIGRLLNLMDQALCTNQDLRVVVPSIEPLHRSDTEVDLEELPFEELKQRVDIVWPQ